MKISIELEIQPDEIGLASELLRTLRCAPGLPDRNGLAQGPGFWVPVVLGASFEAHDLLRTAFLSLHTLLTAATPLAGGR